MVVQDTFGKNGKCSVCKLSEVDCLNYGEIHAVKELAVHLFCLYFSTKLPQRGSDNAGIVGFELRDIRKLIAQCEQTECCYCHKGSATTYCHFPHCRRVFHQACGFKQNARFEYIADFRSFCDVHNSIENENLEYPKFVGCFICYEGLGDYHPVTTVPSCCGKWFHQQCLRRYALNAGYAFMCPTCRNKNYGDFARRHGIYVPEYEALWEKTHDFRDIERFYTHCDADLCICPNGRTFSNHKWNLQLCSCCGSYGFHKLCRPVSERKDIIICSVCMNVQSERAANESEITNPPNEPLTEQNLQRNSDQKRKAEDKVLLIDLTHTKSSVNQNQKSNEAEQISIIDLTETNILEENIAPNESVEETLDEKRKREKAERPIRNEMRDFRISLLFRDYNGPIDEDVEMT